MTSWWTRLIRNPLARVGLIILSLFYAMTIGAGFVAPYHAVNDSQPDGSLLPPTPIHWMHDGQFIGPHVYPVSQGPTDIDTGDRLLAIDTTAPTPIHLFTSGSPYKLLGFIPAKHHLFGVEAPARLNIFGTDEQGRDQFSRLLYGGQISLFVGLVGIAISFPLGMFVGGVSGYFGGWVDGITMRLSEVLMTIPGIYLLVALAAVLPVDLSSAQRFLLIVTLVSFIQWAGLARVVRGQVLSIKEREFIQAARAMGANPLYIIVRHVLPQTASYIIISATLAIPGFIVAESVLSLIGLGIQEPDPSWGNMLSSATNASILVFQPWLIWPPALAIVLTVLSFNLLGDALRDALDPQSVRRS